MEKFTNPKRVHAPVGGIRIPLQYRPATNEQFLPLLLLSFFTLLSSAVQAQYTFSTAGTIGNLSTLDAGDRSTPVIVDLNADGKWDIVSGNTAGTFLYYENIGSAKYSPATPGTPIWTTSVVNPFAGLDVGSFSTPTFADIDGDGDLDLFSGDNFGNFHYYQNNSGVFTEQFGLNNPLGQDEFSTVYDVGSGSTIGFLDTDGDGDLDAVAGNANGEFRHLKNEGDQNNPYFPRFTDSDLGMMGIQQTANTPPNPVPIILAGGDLNATVCVVDMNCDGVFAVVSGTRSGAFQYRQVNQLNGNFRDPLNPVVAINNPLPTQDVSAAGSDFSSPAFGDLDGDGDQDAISGRFNGRFVYFQNQTCAAPPTFSACPSDITVGLDNEGLPDTEDFTQHTLGIGDAIASITAAPAIGMLCTSPGSTASLSLTPSIVTCANTGGSVMATLQAVDNFTGVKTPAAACQIRVTVVDTTAPIAVCTSKYVVEVGQFNVVLGNLPVSAIDSASSDNCTPSDLLFKTLTYSYNTTLPFNCSDIGPTMEDITLSVTDASGNSSSCVVPVVVEDNFPPVPDVAQLAPLAREKCDYDNGIEGEFIMGEEIPVPTATDRCSSLVATAVRVSVNGGPMVAVTEPMDWETAIPGGFTLTGSYTLTWEYEDFYGNVSSQIQPLVIGEPQLVFSGCPTGALPDLEVVPNNGCFRDNLVSTLPDVNSTPASYDPWVSIGTPEICGDPVAAAIFTSPAKGSAFMVGATTVYFSANDGNGHIANCSFNVVVKPTLASLTVTHPSNYVNTTITPTSIAPNVLLNNSQGVPQMPGDGIIVSALSGQCGRVVTWTGAPTVSSPVACANLVTVVAVPASGTFFPLGVTNVKFIATDAKGNTYEVADFDVQVNDLPPNITCPQPSITVDIAPPLCGQLVSIPNAIATDNCPGVIVTNSYTGTTATVNNGIFLSLYDDHENVPTPVVYTATDANGNSSQCTVNVYVRDTQNPVWISCPSTIRVEDLDNICGADIPWELPLFSDNCPFDITVSVDVFDDVDGHVSIPYDVAGCSVPDLNAPISETEAPFNEECYYFNEGTSIVTYVVTDQAGLTASCQFQVVLIDNTAPDVYCPLTPIERSTAINCADTIPTDAYGGQILLIPDFEECGAPVLTYRLASNPLVDLPADYQFPLSETPYNLIVVATDPSGNSSSCPFSILVSDENPPVMTNCPANITVNDTDGGCGQAVTWAGPNFVDDCDENLTRTFNHQSGDIFPVGTTLVSIVAEDFSGNVSPGCSFFVIVVDKTPPVIATCPANQNLVVTNADATCVKTFAYSLTITDDCGPYSVTVSSSGSYTNSATTYSGSVVVAPGLPATVTYTVTDYSSNTSTCSFTVTAIDQQGPFFAYCPPSQTISTANCSGTTATWLPPIIYDFCGNGWNLSLPNHAPGTNFAPGTQTVSYTATDFLGNSSVCSFGITINVIDEVSPTISCAGLPTITLYSTNCVNATGTADMFSALPTASDNCALSPTNPISISSHSFPYAFPLGYSYVSWKALDAAGNMSFCSQTVVVLDDTDPVLTCPSPYTAQLQFNQTAFDICANAGLLGTPSVSDCAFQLPITAVLSPQQCQFVPGSHPIYWQATDNAGNTGTCIQTLIVIAAPSCTPTTPSFAGGSNCGSTTPFALPNANCPATLTVTAAQLGLSAMDNCGNPLNVANQIITVNATGTQVVTFSATVGANTATCSRTVSVTCNAGPCTPNAAPAMAGCGGTIPVDADANCQGTVGSFGVTASDNCGSVMVSSSNSGPFALGNTTVTFTATNAFGTSSCTVVVAVSDNNKPDIISCPEDVTISAETGEEFALSINLEIPIATDNCSVASIELGAGTPEMLFGDGEVVTWVVTDGSGNATECQQNITVSTSMSVDGCADALGIEVATDGAAGDLYGYSVDVDGSRAIIGAPYDDNGKGVNSGAVYILEKDGLGNWVEVAKIISPDGDADDRFGESVAIKGGLVIIGSSKYAGVGAAFVYSGAGASWTLLAKLLASDGAANDDFGTSVDITSTHAIVGAPNDDAPKVNQGSAYIFGKDTGGANNWGQLVKRVASDGETNDNYGISVSIDGSNAVVGSRYDDDFGTNSGSAYVLDGTSSWTELQKLTASDGAAGDYFGNSVAISGIHIIVGSYLDDYTFLNNAGSAYIFENSGLSWAEVAKLIPSDAAAADQFGISVAIDGGTAVVGAHFDDDMGTNSGSAYVFTEGSGWSQVNKLTGASVTTNDNFGRSVGIGGSSVVIGAYKDDVTGLDQGSAYFFGCSNTQPLREEAKERTDVVTSVGGQVRCFPNPSTDMVNIDITLAQEENVQVIISDITGKVISTLYDNKMSGENRLQWEGRQFGNGMYFIRVQSASLREVVPVVIVR